LINVTGIASRLGVAMTGVPSGWTYKRVKTANNNPIPKDLKKQIIF